MATAPSPETQVDGGLFLIFGLAWASGIIHVQAAIGHADESTLFVVLFALLATAQFAWGLAVYRSATARLLWAGAIVSLGVVAFWALSRVVGVPFGPDPWKPEELSVFDAVASADEMALTLLVVMRLWRRPRRTAGLAASGAALALILLSSLSLAGGNGHIH